MPEPLFDGPLADLLGDFIQYKQDRGYAYTTGIMTLRQLERLWMENPSGAPLLSRKYAERFIVRRPTEKTGQTSRYRSVLWRQLALFAARRGFDAYLPDPRLDPIPGSAFTPFIYTRTQLAALFAVVDALPFDKLTPRRAWAMGLLFRLLYGTGFRLGEALDLQYRDFDGTAETLIVRHGKNNKTRTVPVASSLAVRLRKHIRRYPDAPETPFFLSPRHRAPLRHCAVEVLFRELLAAAELPPRAGRVGPRIHDLRHTFAVHRMENWLRDGVTLEAKLPLLATYMGHTHLRDTYYYLRVTVQLFPDIVARFRARLGAIVPEGDAE